MASDVFTDTDESDDDWVDVRMTDPEEGEWDIDVVVAEGQVEFVDLRIRPALLSGFIECLVDDVAEERAKEIIADTATRHGLDSEDLVTEE
ncbi:hypothetical protein EGH21_06420 [Halomicroarcula sp. F13]|uniref:HicB family protein n=1 Tax=Haloarcula rubra TaxID=2487747 RepID=A0AAW4PNB9_9EURY|nr:hypothetical protein [Halomicroarcula rubra]MBX0322661.1 hypothetical protein [Halomicroarcula rubra]